MIELASFGVPIKPGPKRTVIIGTYVVEMENLYGEVVCELASWSSTIQFTSLGPGDIKLYGIYNTQWITGNMAEWASVVKANPECALESDRPQPIRMIEV